MEISNLESPVIIKVQKDKDGLVNHTVSSFNEDLNVKNMENAVGGVIKVQQSKDGKYTFKRNKDILGNLEKMTFKGYEKHVPVKEKLHQMEACMDSLNAMIEEKIRWKEEKLKGK